MCVGPCLCSQIGFVTGNYGGQNSVHTTINLIIGNSFASLN